MKVEGILRGISVDRKQKQAIERSKIAARYVAAREHMGYCVQKGECECKDCQAEKICDTLHTYHKADRALTMANRA